MPNAIMEAMAAGIPVVATDIAGNRDLVVSGETGFLVPLGDRAALGKYGYKLLESAELRSRMGAAARQRIGEFSVARMVDRHAELYRKILSA
jgi:glycosyltransferase involved in cell wall biosynthesis